MSDEVLRKKETIIHEECNVVKLRYRARKLKLLSWIITPQFYTIPKTKHCYATSRSPQKPNTPTFLGSTIEPVAHDFQVMEMLQSSFVRVPKFGPTNFGNSLGTCHKVTAKVGRSWNHFHQFGWAIEYFLRKWMGYETNIPDFLEWKQCKIKFTND